MPSAVFHRPRSAAVGPSESSSRFRLVRASAPSIAVTALALVTLAAAGCAHMLPGITIKDEDHAVKVDPSVAGARPVALGTSGRTAAPGPGGGPAFRHGSGVAARPDGGPAAARSRPVVAVMRVRELDPAGGVVWAMETLPDAHGTSFAKRLAGKDGSGPATVMIPPSRPGERIDRSAALARARSLGADRLLVFAQNTPRRESGSLIYKVVFESRAVGHLLDAATGAACCTVEGDCVGTLGGLTPLQMTVHPHVEPETERKALDKLADAVAAVLWTTTGDGRSSSR